MSINSNKLTVIGLTGSFGSGCSYIAKNIIAENGYQYFSLSDALREEYNRENGDSRPLTAMTQADIRKTLQNFGDALREKKSKHYLAEKIFQKIEEESKTKQITKFVVDSIRNPAEIHFFRSHLSDFFLFGIVADSEIRWNRVKKFFDDERKIFNTLDKEDTGADSKDYGQRVGDCFYEADVVLANHENIAVLDNEVFERLKQKVATYVQLIEKPLSKKSPGKSEETLMAMAYAVSQRSSCLQRKVGAVIVDKFNNIISSGHNEVPREERPCANLYNKCYRAYLLDKFMESIKTEMPELIIRTNDFRKLFKKHIKMLDYCRALHAEESALIALARNGVTSPMSDATLYTTTYPCRLCANKIHDIGIKRVVYLEPYPQEDAKTILKNAGVEDNFFEGVTFRAYFRLYGDQK